MTTILKLHENGDFETVGVPLYQDKNLYVIAKSVPGYVNKFNGNIVSFTYETRTSHYIPVKPGETYAFNVEWRDIGASRYRWTCGYYYAGDLLPVGLAFEFDNSGLTTRTTVTIPENVSHIRLSATFLQNSEDCKIQFERGGIHTGHQLSIEDIKGHPFEGLKISENEILTAPIIKYDSNKVMPDWVVDTGQPISIFKEGIVIKGNLITS